MNILEKVRIKSEVNSRCLCSGLCKQAAVYLESKTSHTAALLPSSALFCVLSQAPNWLLVFGYLRPMAESSRMLEGGGRKEQSFFPSASGGRSG